MVGIIKETGQVHRNSGIFISKKMIAELGFILVIAVIALVVIEAFQSPTTSTGLQQKNTQQVEEAVSTGASTGAANPSQNAIANGQEMTGEGWYAIGESIKFDLMKKYGIMVTITPLGEANGYAIVATESDFGVLFNQNKYLVINTKFRIKGDNEIYETGETPFGPYTGEAIGNWKKTIGKPVDPSNVVWQAEFAVKDIPAQTQKVVTVK